MAGGRSYTPAEIDVIARSVMRQDSADQTYEVFCRAFPDTDRSRSSVCVYRSHDRTMARIHYLCDLLGGVDEQVVSGAPPQVESSESDGAITVSTPQGMRLVKPAVLLERADIPFEVHDGQIVPQHFSLDSCKLNEWPTTMKGPDGSPVQVANYQTTIKLRRTGDRPLLKAFQALIERAGELGPKVPARQYSTPDHPHLLEISIPDLHVGKLAHARESGQDYDSGIARRLFMAAVRDILDRSDRYEIEQVLFLVGSDLIHADNDMGTTYAGTPLDVDSRQHKVIETAYEMLVEAIGECARVAPVACKTIPGNHDRQEALAAGRFLQAWFRADANVEVESEPRTRKYHRYGDCFIGLAHGDEEKPKDLPLIMAQERPQEWGQTKYREWHLGHVHHKREIQALTVDEQTGVRVRHLPSLSRTDAWHARRGYMAQQAAEAFVWSASKGLQDIIHHTPE